MSRVFCRLRQVILLALVAVGLGHAGASAADGPAAQFFGAYEGTTISDSAEGLTVRDLNIKIEPADDDGFSVSWTTVLRLDDGSKKTKAFKITFVESGRPGVYSSAMRRNVFGHSVPHDPLKGQPYVWAAIKGDELTMRALYIDKEGHYEIQVYERKLVEDGLATRFERVREGVKLKEITGHLRKVE